MADPTPGAPMRGAISDRGPQSSAGSFVHRGVIEGFYGPPWSGEERRALVEQIGAWGFNCYVYAPKDDPYHRERWREPYPDDALLELSRLVEAGARAGVEVGVALSPGLSISYVDPDDRAALRIKLRSFLDIGARRLVLALDDVPSNLTHPADQKHFGSLARAHVDVVNAVVADLPEDASLWVIPTDYLGVQPTAYLETLGAELDPRVGIGWTGRTTLSPTISAEEARARAETLRRPLLLWDNLPVADGPMRNMLHLGPYAGRAPELSADVSGVLLNPMQHARASRVLLRAAAGYLRDPVGYDSETAWEEAVAEVGRGAPEAFRRFALAHRFGPQCPDRDPEVEGVFRTLCAELEGGGDLGPPVLALRRTLAARREVAAELRAGLADRALVAEIAPWLDAHACETRRMDVALEALDVLLSDQPAADKVLAYIRMEGRLTRLPPPAASSYGPRRVLYPQLCSLREEDMGFAADPVLIRGENLADEIVDFTAELAQWLFQAR